MFPRCHRPAIGPHQKHKFANHSSSLSPTSQNDNHTIITPHPVLINPQHRIHMMMIPKLSRSPRPHTQSTTCDQKPQKTHLTSHRITNISTIKSQKKTQNSEIPPTSPKPQPQFPNLTALKLSLSKFSAPKPTSHFNPWNHPHHQNNPNLTKPTNS